VRVLVEELLAQRVLVRMIGVEADHVERLVALEPHEPVDVAAVCVEHLLGRIARRDRRRGGPRFEADAAPASSSSIRVWSCDSKRGMFGSPSSKMRRRLTCGVS
jgi:hypothetical protein